MGADNLASTGANWDTDPAPPAAGDTIVINSGSKAITWDIAAEFGTYSQNSGYSGVVTLAASTNWSTTGDITVAAGTLTGVTTSTVSCAGNFTHTAGTITNNALNLTMTGSGKTVTMATTNGLYTLTINDDTYVTHSGASCSAYHLITATSKTLSINSSKIFAVRIYSGSLTNNGIIGGAGTLQFWESGAAHSDTVTFGHIDCPVGLRNISTSNYSILLGANTEFHSTLTVFSDTSGKTMTLDDNGNKTLIVTGAATLGLAGIATQGTGTWQFDGGLVINGTGAIYNMAAGGAISCTNITLTTGEFVEAAAVITASGNIDLSGGTTTNSTASITMTGASKTLKFGANYTIDTLIVNSSGTVALGSAATCTTFTQTAGALSIATYTFTVTTTATFASDMAFTTAGTFVAPTTVNMNSADWDTNGCTFTEGSSTVTFAGTGGNTISLGSSQRFATLNITKTEEALTQLTATNLSISAARTLICDGDLTCDGTFTAGSTSTVLMVGDGTLDIAGSVGHFYNLTIMATGTNIAVTTSSDTPYIENALSIYSSGAGTASFSATENLTAIETDLGVNGILVLDESNVTHSIHPGSFYQTGAGSIFNPGAGTQIYFDNFEISAGTVNASSGQSLVVTTGAWTETGGTLNLSSSLVMFESGCTFTAITPFYDLRLLSGDASTTGNVTVTHDLKLGGATLTASGNVSLATISTSGALVMDGWGKTLTVSSTDLIGAATFNGITTLQSNIKISSIAGAHLDLLNTNGFTIDEQISTAKNKYLYQILGTWATVRNSAYASVLGSDPSLYCRSALNVGPTYINIRTALVFDVSDIPSYATFSGCTLHIASDTDNGGHRIHCVSDPTNAYPSDAITVNDYNIARYDFTTSLGSVVASGAGSFDITLNAEGIARLRAAGSIRFLLIEEHDFDNTTPTDDSQHFEKSGSYRVTADLYYNLSTFADTTYDISFYHKGTAYVLNNNNRTPTNALSSRVMSREYRRDENNPATLILVLSNGSIIPAENMLSSSFAEWSGGAAALSLGDYVRYSIVPTSTLSMLQYFYGKVTELRQSTDGRLTVIAKDYLQKLNREVAKMFFDGYSDAEIKPHIITSKLKVINNIPGVSEGEPIVPLAHVAFAQTDLQKTLANNSLPADGGYNDLVLVDVAQSFVTSGNALVGVKIRYSGISVVTPGTITLSIQRDVAGEPSGISMASDTRVVDGGNSDVTWQVAFTDFPVRLRFNEKYWIVLTYNESDGSVQVKQTAPETDPYATDHLYRTPKTSGSWATGLANEVVYAVLDFLNYEEVTLDNYSYDSATNSVILKDMTPITTTSFTAGYDSVSLYRGMASYYWGTITHKEICDGILALAAIISGTSANQSQTFGIFNTLGKKLIDSLKEAADAWETSGSWTGYQHTFAHYELSGSHYISFGKRQKLTDTPSATFSFGTDTATDDERRIIDYSGLVKRTDLRPSVIMVIGKGGNGNPVVSTVTDQAKSGSFETQMEGFGNFEKLVDENILTLEEADKRAFAAIDSYARDLWEGQIRVSGVYPDLMKTSAADIGGGFFGSGAIVTLNISPLGIVAQPFKVRGISVKENETELTLSNIDFDIQNRLSKMFIKGDKTEAFLAPVGLVTNSYIRCYVDSVVNTATLYMSLQTAAAEITDLKRVACTKVNCATYSGSSLNLNKYHAEFETDNGYTVDGTPIRYVRLYDAATGGSLIATYDLYAAGPPIRDERIYKWRTMRLIVEVLTKNS